MSTVLGNFRRLQRDYYWDSVGVFSIKKPVPVIGTDEVKDRVGMGIALMMLNASRQVGRYPDMIQWVQCQRPQPVTPILSRLVRSMEKE